MGHGHVYMCVFDKRGERGALLCNAVETSFCDFGCRSHCDIPGLTDVLIEEGEKNW